MQDITRFVGAHLPFDRLDETALESLCRRAEISYHPAGEVIVGADSPCTELLVVRHGAVAIHSAEGDLIEKRAEGEMFGDPGLLSGHPERFEVRAEEDTLLYRFPQAACQTARTRSSRFDLFFSGTLANRVQDAVERQADAPQLSNQVRDWMSSPPHSVDADTTVRQAAARMTEQRVSSLLVMFPDDRPGIVTDRDLRTRVVATGLDTNQPVGDVATRELVTIGADATLLDATLVMSEHGVHHLPIFERGKPLGMLTATDLSHADDAQPVVFLKSIRRAATLEDLARIGRQRARLFCGLVREGLPAAHIGRLMTGITDAITQRAIVLATSDLGRPPMAFAWLAFGSQARQEQAFRTDQDNGLVLADIPEGPAVGWFAELAQRVCGTLDRAGIVKCPGEVMATNGKWRQPLSVWRQQFRSWIEEPEPKALMHASIFFDLRCIAGDIGLAEGLLEHVFERSSENKSFLRFMAQNALVNSPPLGFFRRFILEPDGEHSEGLNLKKRGVTPISAMVRVRALEHGVQSPGTLARIGELSERRPNAARDLANLGEAFELIEHFRMDHQAEQIAAGQPPTNFIDPDRMTSLSREHLRAAFEAVRTAQRVLSTRYLIG